MAGYAVSVSRKYARGSVLSSAVPSLRISEDASAAADDEMASAASLVKSSPSTQWQYTSRHSSTRASSVAVGQLLLRPVSSHVTSMATSNSWSTSSSAAGARMRSAARCASTSVGLNRTPTSNSSVNAFASATVRIARSSASSSAGGSASIPAASRTAVASRSTTRRRAASMSVDMAFSVLRSFSSHARADPGRAFSRISRFTVAELTMFRARSAKRSVPRVSS